VNEELFVESPTSEQLKRISEQLKQAREQGGIALEDIAAKTYIPLRLLKAMDEGRFERLPEPVFVQGFIRRYGDEVGLDGTALAKEFVISPQPLKKPAAEFLSQDPEDKSATPAPRNNRTVATVKLPEPLPAPKVEAPKVEAPKVEAPKVEGRGEPLQAEPRRVEERRVEEPAIVAAANVEPPTVIQPPIERESDHLMPPQWQERSTPPADGSGSKLFYWLGGGLMVGLLGLGAFLILGQPQSAPTVGNSNPVSTPVGTTGQQPTPTPTASPTTSPAAQGPVNVSIQVTEDSWVEVETDGNVVTAEILPKGTQKAWAAKKQLILSTGNASGVKFSYNQGEVKPMGSTANPETLTFPPTP
jgi:cytoskeleton protein RodZ